MCGFDLGDMTLCQGQTQPPVMDNNCMKYPDPTWQWGAMAHTRILGMCALWPWPLRYDLGSKSWHTLGSWTIIVWNIIQIGQVGTEWWPGHEVNHRRTNGVIPLYSQILFGGIIIQPWSLGFDENTNNRSSGFFVMKSFTLHVFT